MNRESSVFRGLTWSMAVMMAALPVLLTGCSSTTTLNSSPSGATIFVDGQKLGTTPVQFTSKSIVGTDHQVRLELAGYETTTAQFSRNGDANVGAIIGGIFLLFPFLWTLDYQDGYTFDLQK